MATVLSFIDAYFITSTIPNDTEPPKYPNSIPNALGAPNGREIDARPVCRGSIPYAASAQRTRRRGGRPNRPELECWNYVASGQVDGDDPPNLDWLLETLDADINLVVEDEGRRITDPLTLTPSHIVASI
jgi:hypothetical protein